MSRGFSALAAALVMAACGGASTPEPEAGDGHHHAAGHHHPHGHGHAHHHDSPEALRPLMRDLHGWMGELRGALAADDAEAAARVGATIARACDDQELEAPDPERFGPRFLEHDRALHGGADRLAQQAAAGELDAARASYAEVHAACVACHAQAPTASHVDLSALAP